MSVSVPDESLERIRLAEKGEAVWNESVEQIRLGDAGSCGGMKWTGRGACLNSV